MLTVLPSERQAPPPRSPNRGEALFSIILLIVFVSLEYWRFPSMQAHLPPHMGFLSFLGYSAMFLAPIILAGIAIIGSWLGKIPSGLSLIGELFMAVVSHGAGGDIGNGPIEYRDEDGVSYYFAVFLYFAFACGLVLLTSRK